VWGLIASMYVGNVLMHVINLPLVPLIASLLRTPYFVLYPVILVLCVVGGYSLNGSSFDLWLMFAFGLAGFFLRNLDFPAAPAVLGVVLGPLIESTLRQSLAMSQGNWSIFVSRPISGVLVALLTLIALSPAVVWWRRVARNKAAAGLFFKGGE
jgi:putative tricarboxylic transport membrane protein